MKKGGDTVKKKANIQNGLDALVKLSLRNHGAQTWSEADNALLDVARQALINAKSFIMEMRHRNRELECHKDGGGVERDN